jgi:PAS domain S-box-containing protein
LLTMLLGLIVLYIFKERHRKGLIHSRRNYQRLFDQTLVSIWTEDITDVAHYLEDLYQSGVSDLRAYLLEHPAEVFEIGSKVKVTNLNDVTFDMFRIENRDISAISFADYIPESAIDVLIDFIVSIWEGKARFEAEMTYRRGDGSEFPALVAIQLPSDKNDLKNVPVSIVDITERKRAEEENKSLTQRLLLATSSARLGVWDWNVRENTMVWDDRMFELFGVTRRDPQQY